MASRSVACDYVVLLSSVHIATCQQDGPSSRLLILPPVRTENIAGQYFRQSYNMLTESRLCTCFCQNTPKRMKTEKASIVFSLKANSSISKPPNYKINSRYRPMHLLDMCVRDVALWLGSDQSSPQAQLSNSKPVAQLLGHSLATLPSSLLAVCRK